MNFFKSSKGKIIVAAAVAVFICVSLFAVFNRQNNRAAEEFKNTCTLDIRCSEILNNTDKLKEGKTELIPSDGIIFSSENIPFNEGESVFDVLQREMKKNKIHMEAVNTAVTDSTYVRGINNIFEFDCGPQSGWSYTVNGEAPETGCAQYMLKQGDAVEWNYFCEWK